MNAVSSFRPFGQDAQWDSNQVTAKNSWNPVFDEIIYFNSDEPKLRSKNTFFIGNDEYPTIKEMCDVCAIHSDWVCIINADIVVDARLKLAVQRAKQIQAWALTSWRWQKKDGRWQVIDLGLDFFAALPSLWKFIASKCPPQLRLGHQMWDTWMIAFFNMHAKDHFYDITNWRCIYHPTHSGRRFKHDISGALDKVEGRFCGMPAKLT